MIALLLLGCEATCPNAPGGECSASGTSWDDLVDHGCDSLWENGCDMSGDLSTQFSAEGVLGHSWGPQFPDANYWAALVIGTEAADQPGPVSTTIPAPELFHVHFSRLCVDYCSVHGASGTITLSGEITGCPDTAEPDCLAGSVDVSFDDVVFEDGSTLDGVTWTASY